MRDVPQFNVLEWRCEKMNVIRHYHPRSQLVFRGVVKKQTLLSQFRDAFVFQKASTVTSIKIAFDISAKSGFPFLTIICVSSRHFLRTDCGSESYRRKVRNCGTSPP